MKSSRDQYLVHCCFCCM